MTSCALMCPAPEEDESMTVQDALRKLFNGELYDRKGYLSAEGYAVLERLEGVCLEESNGRKLDDSCEDTKGTQD